MQPKVVDKCRKFLETVGAIVKNARWFAIWDRFAETMQFEVGFSRMVLIWRGLKLEWKESAAEIFAFEMSGEEPVGLNATTMSHACSAGAVLGIYKIFPE